MDKKIGKLCMYINYTALNKVTIKKNSLLPYIGDHFDWMAGAKYFNLVDLKSGYYQI